MQTRASDALAPCTTAPPHRAPAQPWAWVHVHVCMYVCMYVNACVFVGLCLCVNACACVIVCVCVCVCVCVRNQV